MHRNRFRSSAADARNKARQKDHRRALTLLTLSTAVLIAQIDTSVVNLAAHWIGESFHAGVGSLQWVVDSYNLAYAVLLLTGGQLADLYGRRRVFMAGAAVFTAASLLCACATSITILIGARAIAGVGAALLLPASLSTIRVVWPEARLRAAALGIWAACNGVAFAVGPTIGGVLIRWAGWRSVFLVVVPLGAAALILAPLTTPESSDPQHRHFDALGQVLGALTLGCLTVGAIELQTSTPVAVIAICTAIVSLAGFVRVEAEKGTGALVPLDMFGVREFRGTMAATIGMTFGMYGVIFLVPLSWQGSGMLGPVGAGIALMPMALAFVFVSSFSGAIGARLGTRFMRAGGVATIGCGLLLISIAAPSTSLLVTEIGLTLTGLGMGLATVPLMDRAVSVFASARSGTAAALINVGRMAGATMGVAVLGAASTLAHGGFQGLQFAMLLGGLVQLIAAAAVWTATRPTRGSAE